MTSYHWSHHAAILECTNILLNSNFFKKLLKRNSKKTINHLLATSSLKYIYKISNFSCKIKPVLVATFQVKNFAYLTNITSNPLHLN